jgi:hypothetical protein
LQQYEWLSCVFWVCCCENHTMKNGYIWLYFDNDTWGGLAVKVIILVPKYETNIYWYFLLFLSLFVLFSYHLILELG